MAKKKKNFIFEMTVEIHETAHVRNMILVTAPTYQDAVLIARGVALDWWGEPTSCDAENWIIEHKQDATAYISADPTFKGEFTNAELKILGRACDYTRYERYSHEAVIAEIQEAMDSGMDKPPSAMLAKLFGEALAARAEVELTV